MSKNLLREYIQYLVNETFNPDRKISGKLVIFDFDDTLVKTNSKVRMKKSTGEILHLTPAEYAVYEKEPEDQPDYSDFTRVAEPEPIEYMIDKLKNEIDSGSHVIILTARGPIAAPKIKKYLRRQVGKTIPVIALGDSLPEKKAEKILKFAISKKFNEIEFYDDSPKNIEAANKIKKLLDSNNEIKELFKLKGMDIKLTNVHVRPH